MHLAGSKHTVLHCTELIAQLIDCLANRLRAIRYFWVSAVKFFCFGSGGQLLAFVSVLRAFTRISRVFSRRETFHEKHAS